MRLKTWLEFITAFTAFNIIIGITLFFYYPRIPLTVVSPTIPQGLWATIFLLSGLLTGYGIIKKHFKLLWTLMMLGVFVKSMWEIGFIIRYFAGGSLLQTEIWGLLSWVQILLVIHFDRRVLT